MAEEKNNPPPPPPPPPQRKVWSDESIPRPADPVPRQTPSDGSEKT